MRTPFTRRMALVVFSLVSAHSFAQTLQHYIKEGLENNLVLQQKDLSLERALLGLKIANGMFLPQLSLQGNYTHGDGGRNISFPVGDMLNPVYATLNQLTDSDQFPQIENVSQNFFPQNFYDVKVRAQIPIVNTDLVYNKKIQAQQVILQEFEVDIYKRELIKNIQVAYFNYLTAKESIAIYESALNRALEGKRVSESLLANGKGLQAYVLRSESEIENIRSQIKESEKQSLQAQLYFNFLLNRDANASIDSDASAKNDLAAIPALLSSSNALDQREELKQLREISSVQQTILKKNKLFWAPRLNAFIDGGSQYENLQFNEQSKYYLFGFQLDVPLFAGFTNRNKITQSRIDVKQSELNHSLVRQQLNMSTAVARSTVESNYQSYLSSRRQLEAAQSYQRLIEKGYKEGVNTFIESVDARNQLTGAQLLVTINEYRVLTAKAHYDRETAAISLNQ